MLNTNGQMRYVDGYLRRRKTIDQLVTLGDEIFLSATEEVTITMLANDGVHTQGTVTFPKAVIGLVVENLLREASVLGLSGSAHLPLFAAPLVADFSYRRLQT